MNELLEIIGQFKEHIKQNPMGNELLEEIENKISQGKEVKLKDGQIVNEPITKPEDEIFIYIDILETYFVKLPACINSTYDYFNEYSLESEIHFENEVVTLSKYDIDEIKNEIKELRQMISDYLI
ncbi:hypothetical protein [Bacillus sp. ISL-46]|uniref:hypothetical protein n=1 Tax=Bacillus sp. ISL-46 TaxID=2819129 RepID=UPI001BE624F5|nr:hypothetical protein [Bacillus sp. ISL-46]MBT2721459.1 hypothetical protein [Bacillus sp. ISL-46]